VPRVNSKAISPDDLDRALVREQKGALNREVYVEADGALQWGDVVRVIDIAEGVGNGYVVLLTTTPPR
jgi:biopolymer transport protein ExbD